MKTLPVFFLLLAGILFTNLLNAQCPGCQVNLFACDSATADGQVCADTIPDAAVGTAYDTEVTFRFPRRLTLQQGDPIPLLNIPFPALPGFPTVIVMDVLRVKLDSIGGLPQGLQWECDSSANGCLYIPGPGQQSGCVKICGNLGCNVAPGNVSLTFYFSYVYDGQDFIDAVGGAVNPIPIPLELPVPTLYTVGLKVSSNGPSGLAITTNKPTTIGYGESITLSATAGYSVYQWSTGHTSDSLTIRPTQSGFYSVTATDAHGCTKQQTIGITVIGTSGINELSFGEISVIPNPNNGEFAVEWQKGGSELNLSVHDLFGKVILNETLNPSVTSVQKINLRFLGSGIYFIQLNDDKRLSVKKVVVN